MLLCKRWIVLVLLTFLLTSAFQGLTDARGNSKIYWIEGGIIKRANLDGSSVENVITDLFIPTDITLDKNNGKIIWVDDHTAKTQRANLDGSNIETLFAAFNFPGGEGGMVRECKHGNCRVIAQPKNGNPVEVPIEDTYFPRSISVDSRSNKLYWANRYFSDIKRANLDGTDIEDVIKKVLGIWHLKLDTKAGKMFWTERGSERIRSANLDGTNIVDIVANWPDILSGLALDVNARRIYWTNPHKGTIKRASYNGNNIEEVVTGLVNPEDIDIDTQLGQIYWTSWDRKTDSYKIQRASLDGSNVTDIITDLKRVNAIALDTDGLYDVRPGTEKLATTWANVKKQ